MVARGDALHDVGCHESEMNHSAHIGTTHTLIGRAGCDADAPTGSQPAEPIEGLGKLGDQGGSGAPRFADAGDFTIIRTAMAQRFRCTGTRAGLRELGYTEIKNFSIDWRFVGGGFDRFSAPAAD